MGLPSTSTITLRTVIYSPLIDLDLESPRISEIEKLNHMASKQASSMSVPLITSKMISGGNSSLIWFCLAGSLQVVSNCGRYAFKAETTRPYEIAMVFGDKVLCFPF